MNVDIFFIVLKLIIKSKQDNETFPRTADA